MSFLLWVTRSFHIFSVIVWFGGMLYHAVVLHPVARVEQKQIDKVTLHFIRRFQPFVWMSVWTLCITGIALMLFDPRFVAFELENRWSVLLAAKQIVFFVMAFFSVGYARMFHRAAELAQPGGDAGRAMAYVNQMTLFCKINVALGIMATLITAAMNF